MTKKEVKRRLCVLATKVMNEKFRANIPADCFCGMSIPSSFGFGEEDYQFDEQIILFIENAVNQALSVKETTNEPNRSL
jgi:hypothetical protein